MNRLTFSLQSRRWQLAAFLVLFAGQNLRAGITFTNTPAAVGNAYSGLITLQIGGLNTGETVVVQKFLDLNNNGVVDPSDYLVGQFNLTDGQAGMVVGGVTNPVVPGDNDTTAGQITAKINLALSGFEQTTIGRFLYVVSSPTARFTPVTNSLAVTNTSYAQSISGNVMNNGTGIPNAVVLLLVPGSNGHSSPQTGVVSDGTGHFTIEAPPGGYALVAIKAGYVADTSVSPFVVLNSGAAATANLTLTPATQTISGSLVDANNSSIRLAGVLVPGQTQDGLLSVAYTDTNGNFTITTTPGNWKINGQGPDIAFHGYVSPDNSLKVNSSGGSLSGVVVSYPKATALVYGRVTDASGNPLPGIDIFANDYFNNIYGVDSFSDANGNYYCGVVGGLGGNDPWYIAPSSDSNPANLIFSQPALDQNGGTNLGVGQAALANFTALVATNQISGTVRDSHGNPISGVGVSGYATINGLEFNPNSVDTDTNGNYTLNVANGDWGVFVFCNGGSDTLDGILGPGNYECPNNQNVTINNNNGTINFTVQPAGSYQIFGYLRDTGNAPVTGVQVRANGPANLTAATDNNGFYSFNVGVGNWDISVDCTALSGRGYSCPADQQVNISSGGTEIDFTVSQCESLAITTGDTLPDADATFNYNDPLQSVGCNTPITWSLSTGSLPLPSGLTLYPAGVIFGTPSTNAIGTNYFSLMVTDNAGNTANQIVSLIVHPAPQITNSSLPNATLQTPYSVQLGSTGGDGGLFGWNIVSGSLPPGLTLFLNGVISGTPSQTGTFTFTVGARDNANGQPQKVLSITVISSFQITTTLLTPGYTGTSYSVQLQASGGTTPYTWSIANGSQPPPSGLTLASGGLLSGTPTAAGTFSFIVKVTDANSSTATHSLSLTVNARPSLSAPHRLGNGSFVFTVSGVANQNYTIQYSSTLTNWSTLVTTNSATPSFQIADPLNFKLRYYRVLVGP